MRLIIHKGRIGGKILYLFALLFVVMMGGCAAPTLVLVDPPKAPQLLDDLDIKSIETASTGSLNYYDRISDAGMFVFGNQKYSTRELKESLHRFQEIMHSHADDEVRRKKILESFDIYKVTGSDNKGTVLFTGYYEPILEGSLTPSEKYKYPVYKTPDDLIKIQPETCEGGGNPCEKIIGRYENGKVAPYYSRKEIDGYGVLAGRNLAVVWLDDPVALFFLHIQGSGKIRLPDGTFIQISYAQSNGRPYRGIAKYLREMNRISDNEMSYQGIKKYLYDHPDERDDIFSYNERYIFFRIVDQGPVGALGAVVTAGRSIATDPKIFPRGALAFIRLRKPVLDHANNKVIAWQPFSRFVFNQDEGSAIKGPGRVDLFCGSGEEAELFAGSLKEKGELYFLVKKK